MCVNPQQRSFVDFCIGRNYLYLGEVDKAEAWLEKSLTMSPGFHWSYYELARLRHDAGDLAKACRYLVAFSRAILERGDVSDLNEIHIKTAIEIAHQSFDLGSDRDVAIELYHMIVELGVRDYLCELRIVELALDQERLGDATDYMARLQASFTLEAWGFLVYSRLEFAQGEGG